MSVTLALAGTVAVLGFGGLVVLVLRLVQSYYRTRQTRLDDIEASASFASRDAFLLLSGALTEADVFGPFPTRADMLPTVPKAVFDPLRNAPARVPVHSTTGPTVTAHVKIEALTRPAPVLVRNATPAPAPGATRFPASATTNALAPVHAQVSEPAELPIAAEGEGAHTISDTESASKSIASLPSFDDLVSQVFQSDTIFAADHSITLTNPFAHNSDASESDSDLMGDGVDPFACYFEDSFFGKEPDALGSSIISTPETSPECSPLSSPVKSGTPKLVFPKTDVRPHAPRVTTTTGSPTRDISQTVPARASSVLGVDGPDRDELRKLKPWVHPKKIPRKRGKTGQTLLPPSPLRQVAFFNLGSTSTTTQIQPTTVVKPLPSPPSVESCSSFDEDPFKYDHKSTPSSVPMPQPHLFRVADPGPASDSFAANPFGEGGADSFFVDVPSSGTSSIYSFEAYVDTAPLRRKRAVRRKRGGVHQVEARAQSQPHPGCTVGELSFIPAGNSSASIHDAEAETCAIDGASALMTTTTDPNIQVKDGDADSLSVAPESAHSTNEVAKVTEPEIMSSNLSSDDTSAGAIVTHAEHQNASSHLVSKAAAHSSEKVLEAVGVIAGKREQQLVVSRFEEVELGETPIASTTANAVPADKTAKNKHIVPCIVPPSASRRYNKNPKTSGPRKGVVWEMRVVAKLAGTSPGHRPRHAEPKFSGLAPIIEEEDEGLGSAFSSCSTISSLASDADTDTTNDLSDSSDTAPTVNTDADTPTPRAQRREAVIMAQKRVLTANKIAPPPNSKPRRNVEEQVPEVSFPTITPPTPKTTVRKISRDPLSSNAKPLKSILKPTSPPPATARRSSIGAAISSTTTNSGKETVIRRRALSITAPATMKANATPKTKTKPRTGSPTVPRVSEGSKGCDRRHGVAGKENDHPSSSASRPAPSTISTAISTSTTASKGNVKPQDLSINTTKTTTKILMRPIAPTQQGSRRR